MTDLEKELDRLYQGKFRPDDWANRIANKTHKSASTARKVLKRTRTNIDVAIAIVSLFNLEIRKLNNKTEEAKNDSN